MRYLLLLPCLILMLASCETTDTNGDRNSPVTDAPQAPHRDVWQKPQELISLIDGGVGGRTIADLFAGDGYFTFHLIDAGARVIAIDSDPSNIAKLEARRKEMGLTDEQLIIRQSTAGDPGLRTAEADAAILVHAYPQIADRKSYFKQLREGLRGAKPLYIVAWQNRETPVGPPVAERLPVDRYLDELGEYGFSGVGARGDKMPYQVIILASDPVDMDETEYRMHMDNKVISPM